MAFAGVPIACLWLATALFLGRRHEQLREHARAAGSVGGR
jgi:hypothetical protein